MIRKEEQEDREAKAMCVLLPKGPASTHHKANEFLALFSKLRKPKWSLLVLIFF